MGRLVVVGAGGMLGSAVDEWLPSDGVALTRAECDILSSESIAQALRPDDTVINCAGKCNTDAPVNSLGPLNLAMYLQDGHLYHVSTDCVFSGRERAPYRYAVGAMPDDTSPYGIAKREGELGLGNVTNVRTSFVGHVHGLLNWLERQPCGSVVPGYTNAYWTGSDVDTVAEMLVGMAQDGERASMVHLATADVYTKFELLRFWCRELGLDVHVQPVDAPYVNRALEPTIELEPVMP